MTATRLQPYNDSREHIDDYLEWLDRALALLLHKFHRRGSEDAAQGHGWFISPKEAELLLSPGRPPSADEEDLAASLRSFRQRIRQRCDASLKQHVYLALPHLTQMFALSSTEELVLVACLAPELDGRYSRLYGYLHDDLTRRYPTFDLISKLIAAEAGRSTTPQLVFSKNAAIFRWALIHAVGDGAVPAPGLSQGLVIDSRVAAFVLGIADVDDRIASFARIANPLSEFDDARPYLGVVDRLRHFLISQASKPAVYFHGPAASEGPRVAAAICRYCNLGLLRIHIGELLQSASSGSLTLSEGLRRVFREALLRSAAVYISDFDDLDDSRTFSWLRVLERVLLEGSWLIFIEGKRFLWPPADQESVAVLPFQLDIPDYHERRREWQTLAAAPDAEVAAGELESLATLYRLTISEMRRAYRMARSRAAMRPQEDARVRINDLRWAARTRAHAHFGSLARTMTPRATWEDLVLPEATTRQLHEICEQVRHRATVLHDWGFEGRLSTGKGLYAMFVGPSGTGKTLAAEVMASTLGRDLIKVDLSGVVSKYIGETEKHLDRIFEGAERSDGILFFDEADALFGKRAEIHDAHDRYANIEVNYLLQRLEQFEGIVILATNLAQNIDDAFSRRIHFSVEFPFPNEISRARIWQTHLPEETPVAPDLDFGLLARQYKIAGGNIRNIAVNAAFLAAAGCGRVGMVHLHQATRREYEKMGKFWEEGKQAGGGKQ